MKKHPKRLGILLIYCLLAFSGQFVFAQDDGLLMRLDFQHLNGNAVADPDYSGVTATLSNGATVDKMGKYNVLNLGNNNGYLDLTEKAGDLFRQTDVYTISMYYRVNENASLTGSGFFLWAFSTLADCSDVDGKYSAYRLNAQRFANSTGGYKNEVGIEKGGESEKGKWMHVLYTQNGTAGTLYLNGVRVGANVNMPLNSTNFNSSIPYVWIGRAPFAADSYLKQTLVYDIRLYKKALDADEIKALSNVTEDLEYQYRYGEAGDFSKLESAVNEAKSFIADNVSSYPAAAIDIYQDEINIAQDLINEGKVNQSQIDEQISRLEAARQVLEASAGFVFADDDVIEGYDPERGFRHPGGLHSQEDFDRIRQQLDEKNAKVVSAYNTLINATYSQSDCGTSPVEYIIRGGGVGENYINAARGATIAYQNALRWKIDGSKEHAHHAVDVLMQWARTTKGIGGDSNYALAAGIYGYQFAQAAELVRDYEGWSAEDFNYYKQWMLNVWYPSCIGFLRGRNGTWENAGRWWQAPGHYWSNWGLCNVLAVMSIGILCDDVYIYNQGLSYFKYDQVGTFTDPRTDNPIKNDGLTEFLGNLVVTTQESELETGAYGKLGQMQESGRDIGHASFAAGLAVDIAQIAWNQGDDLFSYMDNRLAAGIEYVAAQMQGVEGLPWTNYHYGSSGYHWSDYRAWLQTGPAQGEQIRPYWGTVIGHYEGIKGVEMPFSKVAYNKMGIDGGGAGATSGGYDHLGYSVLMHTRDKIAPEMVPTPLTPEMEYNGVTVEHNELGGLKNTFQIDTNTGLPAGTVVTLKPQLPDDCTDTGLWEWSTGEKTKDITVVADRSGVWRATYTNDKGVKSEQVFTIAVEGDCMESMIEAFITTDGNRRQTNTINVLYGNELTLEVNAKTGWGEYVWENGVTGNVLTLSNVTTSRDISCLFTSQGGRKQKTTFHINVQIARPDIKVNTTNYSDTTMVIVEEGDSVVLYVTPANAMKEGTYLWSDGTTDERLVIKDIKTSCTYSLEYKCYDKLSQYSFQVYVKDPDRRKIENGDYYIRHKSTDTYMTNTGNGGSPVFRTKNESEPLAQQWRVNSTSTSTSHSFMSLLDSMYVDRDGGYSDREAKAFRMSGAIGSELLAIQGSLATNNAYWGVESDGNINFTFSDKIVDYDFEFIPVDGGTDVKSVEDGNRKIVKTVYYSPSGIGSVYPHTGINIRVITYDDGTTKKDKIIIK